LFCFGDRLAYLDSCSAGLAGGEVSGADDAAKEEVAMGGVQAKEAERDRSTATIASQH